MSEVKSTLPIYSQNMHEEELLSLKKHMRTQEAEWKKNKAVLEQRIEILEIQNRELKEREDNLKKMNNSFFSALGNFNKENDPSHSKLIKEMETAKQQINRDFADHRTRTQEIIKNLERENKEQKERISELDLKCKQTALHYEKNDAVLQQKVQSLENEKQSLNSVLKMYEGEIKQYKEKEFNANELQSKLAEVRYLLEKQANDHRNEMERVRMEYSQTMNNLKTFAEAEKNAMENQIRKVLDSKKLDVNSFEDIKKKYEGEIGYLKRERDNLIKKSEALEKQISQLNEALRAAEEKLSHQKTDQDKESKEVKKLKAKIADLELRIQLKKYEQSEKNLKQLLAEKDHKVDDVAADLKKKLQYEKKRYEQAQEVSKKHKEEIEKRCTLIMQEVLLDKSIKKDEIIKKLKSQIRKDEKLNRKGGDNDMNKTETSFVNMSLINHSLSKYNPSRSFLQEMKTTRDGSASRSIIKTQSNHTKPSYGNNNRKVDKGGHRDNTDTGEDEENQKDPANENILVGLNSPSIFNTHRSHVSNRRDEVPGTSRNKSYERQVSNRREERSQPNINLCEACNQDMDIKERKTEEENTSYSHRETNLNITVVVGTHNTSHRSFEVKKKSASFCETGAQNEKLSFGYKNRDQDRAGRIDFEDTRSFQNPLSLNQSVQNISRTQDLLEASQHHNISSFRHHQQDNGYEFTEQTRQNYSDDKVRELEQRLREAVQKNEKTALEKERLQVELDRLILELKQTKMEWALSEESKEECELALKNEIKFLINKLLQVKSTGINPNSSQADLSQFTKSTLNKSTLEPQLSFINTSAFSNISHYNGTNHFVSSTSNTYEQNNMTIINNNLGERKMNEFNEKVMRKGLKVDSEESDTSLKSKCLNSGEFDSLNESPKKVSEFNNNENNLLMNLLNTRTHPKKLMRHIKR